MHIVTFSFANKGTGIYLFADMYVMIHLHFSEVPVCFFCPFVFKFDWNYQTRWVYYCSFGKKNCLWCMVKFPLVFTAYPRWVLENVVMFPKIKQVIQAKGCQPNIINMDHRFFCIPLLGEAGEQFLGKKTHHIYHLPSDLGVENSHYTSLAHSYLAGGFKDFLFSTPPGEMIQFD